VNGISWATPRFLMANYASLIAAYGVMLIYLRIKKNVTARAPCVSHCDRSTAKGGIRTGAASQGFKVRLRNGLENSLHENFDDLIRSPRGCHYARSRGPISVWRRLSLL
jgi:hypothetical protein